MSVSKYRWTEACESQPCPGDCDLCSKEPEAKNDDLISRQDAIDALSNGALINYQAAGHNNGLVKAIDVIKGLTSAQPDLDEWCTDCSEYDRERHYCPRWNRVIRQTLKDAQPEREGGEWVLQTDPNSKFYNWYRCSNCGAVIGDPTANFCSECGCDMRGDTE